MTFNFIGVGDGIWIPLSAPFLEKSEVYKELIIMKSEHRNK